jgi:hypothetical protein
LSYYIFAMIQFSLTIFCGFRYRNWRALDALKDEIRKEKAVLKVKTTGNRIPSCLGLSMQKWGKL